MKTRMRIGIVTVGLAAAIGLGGGTAMAADPDPNAPAAAVTSPIPWEKIEKMTVEEAVAHIQADRLYAAIKDRKVKDLPPRLQKKTKDLLIAAGIVKATTPGA